MSSTIQAAFCFKFLGSKPLLRSWSNRKAFTLVELLVVIAIIGVLVALLLPAVQAARESARRVECINHLKQIGLAVHSFHDAREIIPPCGIAGWGEATWPIHIMPYLEQNSVFDAWRPFYDLYGAYYLATDEVRKIEIPLYYCPSRRGVNEGNYSRQNNMRPPWNKGGPGALGDYATSFGDVEPFSEDPFPTGPFLYPPQCEGSVSLVPPDNTKRIWNHGMSFRRITDGLSNTLFVGEKHVRPDEWGLLISGDTSIYSDDIFETIGRSAGTGFPLAGGPMDDIGANRRFQFGSSHPGTCNFVMGDGRVVTMSTDMDTQTLGRLSNREDGMVSGTGL